MTDAIKTLKNKWNEKFNEKDTAHSRPVGRGKDFLSPIGLKKGTQAKHRNWFWGTQD